MTKATKLPPRKIIVGCDEDHREITVTDQATLRLIAEIVNLIPDREVDHAV